MIQGILGTKQGSTQTFAKDGRRVAVTYVTAGPCWVTKVVEADSHRSIQLGFGIANNLTKPLLGSMQKAGLTTKPRFLRELQVSQADPELTVGTRITADQVFAVGDAIRVSGVSKGKGFAGVVKRYGFAGGPRTHGQSDRERAPGSIGSGTTPGRVFKGKKMAGRMGGDTVTVRNLRVVSIDPATHVMGISGVLPGARNGLLIIEKEQKK